jgi:hypothetical protein
MTNRGRAGIVVLAGFVVAAAAVAAAQTSRTPAQASRTWKAEEALPLTCAQAWVQSGKSYPGMLAVVAALARVSLANRDLTFPNTREAGVDAGKGIAEDCKGDPHALLFAVVDKHVRRVAEAAPRAGR